MPGPDATFDASGERTPSADVPAARARRRVAVVIVRWGEGILGGAEAHARMLVEAIRPHHDVTVLTSCARDATSWAMHHAAGREVRDGLTVLRFAHPPRNEGGRARVPLRHKLRFWLRPAFDALGLVRAARPRGDDRLDGHEFLRRQGPWCPELIDHLRDAAADYDCVVFFTALYSPTAHGLPARGPRSLLIPTLHDEKPMLLPWFHAVFRAPGLVLYNAAGERRLARRLYGLEGGAGSSGNDGGNGAGADRGRSRVVGAAVEVRPPAAQAIVQAAASHRLGSRWIVYVGRIEKGKGCADLVAAWLALPARERGDATLVLVGDGALRTPEHPSLRRTGYLEPAARDAIVAGAWCTVVPSRNESLSLALLESLALGVPVVANGRCEVLEDHVADSGAGESYRSRRGLRAALARALGRSAGERERMGQAGRRYVAGRYGPAVVQRGWLDAIDAVAGGAG